VSIAIKYDLVGTGWSACRVVLGDEQIEVTASYLSDALGNLSAGAVLLLEGADEVRFSFDEEPGEYRWIIRQANDEAHLRILGFDRLWGNQPDEEGQLLLDTRLTPRDFARAVRDALVAVRDRFGPAGYRERWVDHDFPEVELNRLDELLRNA
jgi:hypothetical protein